ncbi:MAG: PD-(D/E)XK nuclease family protein [Chloroflexota bacterium]
MSDPAYELELEAYIRQVFEQNYEELRLDSGHAISPDVKRTALNQVLLYWRVLRDIAENVTDTEVRLNLPGQETPRGRDYTIEGVVDILREKDRTVMYDIKTHDADYVRANLDLYEQQLNVYAHIWKELRKQRLDEMAVIATDYPEAVRDALANENDDELAYALRQWQPVVPIEFDPRRLEETVKEFGQVVDAIEDGRFVPPPLEKLQEHMPGLRNIRFGTHVCRNCDARFSCSSYRQYAWLGGRQTADRAIMQYLQEALTDAEQESWRSANLEVALDANTLNTDFTTR